MCGIVAYVGPRDAVPILVEGLERLEYRGYDSAGLAVVGSSGLRVHKAKGKVREVTRNLPKRFRGSPGIAHTRWATHGEPSDVNAHPHTDEAGRVAVVHNGIIENAAELRAKLSALGVKLVSDTDTEVLAHLIALAGPVDLAEAVRQALSSVAGTFGVAVIRSDQPDEAVVARNGSPVILGLGEREMLAASDVAALVRHTSQVVHLDDGELAVLRADGYRTTTLEALPTAKQPSTVQLTPQAYEKGSHPDFMHKEIHEQPEAIERALAGRFDRRFNTAHLERLGLDTREAAGIRRVKVLGCGSAYFAGLLGALTLERLARIPADAEPASEYRDRNPVIEPDVLHVAVSQSGETYDTLAAVQEIRRRGGRVLGLVNVVGSTIARECDGGIYLHAGPEVSVTSTKTFTSTALAFCLLALFLGRVRDLGPAEGRRIIDGLSSLPELLRATLGLEPEVADLARRYAGCPSALYIGRVAGYPVALEGAQKLKEVSYIHAEAYPASELKHGPLALVTSAMPTIAVLPDDDLVDKNLSSVAEIRARGGPVIGVGHDVPAGVCEHRLVVPRCEPELDPILLTVPLQLFAYHAAVELGRNIDQPRNLAKSVTVG
jgi:glucosamine--fructose-6-phosphate aminotransferase (isomerizing)